MLLKNKILINLQLFIWIKKLSKNKGFSETSADRYSLALYELATEANMLSEIEVHTVSIINLIDSCEDFKSLIKKLKSLLELIKLIIDAECTSISLSMLDSVANS